MEQLKSCPFCGSKAEMHTEISYMRRYTFDTKTEAEQMVKQCQKYIIPAQIQAGKRKNGVLTDPYEFYVEVWPCEYAPRCSDVRCVGHNTNRTFLAEVEATEAWNRRV